MGERERLSNEGMTMRTEDRQRLRKAIRRHTKGMYSYDIQVVLEDTLADLKRETKRHQKERDNLASERVRAARTATAAEWVT